MLAANGKSADKDQLLKLLRQLESLSDTSHHTLAKAVRVLPDRINAFTKPSIQADYVLINDYGGTDKLEQFAYSLPVHQGAEELRLTDKLLEEKLLNTTQYMRN